MSIVFDRAAAFYDRTRALPPQIARLPAETLRRETGLSAAARVLEIGVGTGRIAIPLAGYVRRLTGIDLSLAMMAQLRSKLVEVHTAVDLAQADALYLPFPADTFDLIYAVHVLHLIPGWQEAVAEAWRALKPGGFFAVNWHRRVPNSPNAQIRQELRELVAPYGVSTKRPGAQSEQEILAELRKWDPEPRLVDVAEWTEVETPREIIDELDEQIFSETWSIPRPVLAVVVPRLREWARERYGSLDRALPIPHSFRWLIIHK